MDRVPIQQWIERQPNKLLATYAAALARVGCDLPQMLAEFGKRWPGVAPDPSDWMGCYRDHRRLAGAVRSLLPGGPDTLLMVDIGRAVRRCSPEDLRAVVGSIPAEERVAVAEAAQEQAKVFEDALAAVAYNDVRGAGELAGFVGEIPLELWFLVRVVLPYLIEHGDLPTRDFARARRGRDLPAFERIVAIDPSVIVEPRIAREIAASVLVGKGVRLRLLTDAINKKPSSARAGQCKMLMAALMVASFENAKLPLSVRDVRDLFDAIAKAEHGRDGVLIDSDLPDSPEAMAKGIQRYKRIWRPMIGRMASLGTGQKLS